MSKITFEQLLARREQREQDKYRVGLLTIPGSGVLASSCMGS